MFGLDFFELVVIFVVALVVLGPTRLPGVARKVGRWIGKARGMARDFRQQLENEVTLDELNKMTEKHSRHEPPPAAPTSESVAPKAEAAAMADAPADSGNPLAGSGYPHGASAEVGAVEPGAAPLPGDDNYSHAHAAGDVPPSWSPAEEVEPFPQQPELVRVADSAVTADATDSTLKPDPSAPAPDKAPA